MAGILKLSMKSDILAKTLTSVCGTLFKVVQIQMISIIILWMQIN